MPEIVEQDHISMTIIQENLEAVYDQVKKITEAPIDLKNFEGVDLFSNNLFLVSDFSSG